MKSPFKDNKELVKEINVFLDRYGYVFSQQAKKTAQFFEIAVFNSVVKFFTSNGLIALPANLCKKTGSFLYALSPTSKPQNSSYFKIIKREKNRKICVCEVRHNVHVQSAHDDNVFLTPDISVIAPDSVVSKKREEYYGGKVDYYYVECADVTTFAEAKHYNPSPELVINFVGIVNELMPELMHGKCRVGGDKVFTPALVISGSANRHIDKIKESLAKRYNINVFVGIFSDKKQLYARGNSGGVLLQGCK